MLGSLLWADTSLISFKRKFHLFANIDEGMDGVICLLHCNWLLRHANLSTGLILFVNLFMLDLYCTAVG